MTVQFNKIKLLKDKSVS